MSPISEHLGVPWLVRNAVEKLNPTIEYQLTEKDGQMEFAITTRLTAGISKVRTPFVRYLTLHLAVYLSLALRLSISIFLLGLYGL